jgi:DNA-binding winged helix-turn-helix (wHTH) protein
VWGPTSTIEESTIDAEIVRLRRAIGGRKRETPIRTIRKLGYTFEIPKRRPSSKGRLSTDSGMAMSVAANFMMVVLQAGLL